VDKYIEDFVRGVHELTEYHSLQILIFFLQFRVSISYVINNLKML
jgi:hypothetical protein